MNPEEIRKGLRALLDFLGLIARLTPSKKDDDLVTFLLLLVDTPGLLELLIHLIRGKNREEA